MHSGPYLYGKSERPFGHQFTTVEFRRKKKIKQKLVVAHTSSTPKVDTLYDYKVVCLLLKNSHKMTRQAMLNVCTEPFCVHFSKINKLPYDITTLVISTHFQMRYFVA